MGELEEKQSTTYVHTTHKNVEAALFQLAKMLL